jgi:cytochrome c553
MGRFPLIVCVAAFAATLGLTSATSAASMPQGILAPEQIEILAKGDPGQSAKIAKKCGRCHGKDGISDDDEVPHLAGQNPRYVFKQLWDYKHNYRDGGRIKRIAKRLTPQDIANLTARFSSQALPSMGDVAVPTPPDLVARGDARRGVDACVDCHRSDGKGGDGDFELPALAGMPYDYFVETMLSFKDGLRYNDPDGVMGNIATALSEKEIGRLADYYLALGQRKRMATEE